MKNILVGSAVLAAVLLFIIVAKTPITPFAADTNLSNQAQYADSGNVVAAYYQALNHRDIAGAVELLPDDVVLEFNLLHTSTRVKYSGIEDVQHWLEYDHTTFSRSLDKVFVRGDMVEYTLTEWVNPRGVGANSAQPVVTHWTATLHNGKILMLSQDPAAD